MSRTALCAGGLHHIIIIIIMIYRIYIYINDGRLLAAARRGFIRLLIASGKEFRK